MPSLIDPKWILAQDPLGNLTLIRDDQAQVSGLGTTLASGLPLSATLAVLEDAIYKAKQ